jgi:catechol 2,3-dioxygenase-like lactoylglutathione lyase family enzyme
MITAFDSLLKQYECGAMTRRQLLAAMTLLVAPASAPAQTSLFRARSLNHVNFRVTDVARSEAFYRKVLGVPRARPAAGNAFALDLPAGGSISLCPVSVPTCGIKKDGRPGDIDHVGIGIDNFNAARVESELTKAGFKPYNNTGPSVFVDDPDGTPIQLSAASEKFPVRP